MRVPAPDGTASGPIPPAGPARGARRGWRARLRGNLVGDQSGVAAIEFAMVATPFVAMLVSIAGLGLVFFLQQVLETAVDDGARLILTGQAQGIPMTASTFKDEVCRRLPPLFDCAGKVQIDVQTYQDFSAANVAKPIVAGLVDWNPVFKPGKAGDIVVVRAIYPMPSFSAFYGVRLSNLMSGQYLLMATSVFRNEPFAS